MTIYKSSSMHKLAKSKHPTDLAILDFAQRNGIRSLSYKDYKYLYAGATLVEISEKLSGGKKQGAHSIFATMLDGARQDEKVEKGEGKFTFHSASESLQTSVDQCAKDEIEKGSFGEHLSTRVNFADVCAKFAASVTGTEHKAAFWKHLVRAGFLFDTLSDFLPDWKAGHFCRPKVRDFSFIFRGIFSAAKAIVSELGAKYSAWLTATECSFIFLGALQNKERKIVQQKIIQPTVESQHLSVQKNIPRTSSCPALHSQT